MSATREEIEAAMQRYDWLPDDASLLSREDVRVMDTLALAYFSEHTNDQQPPTREMFDRLGAKFWHSDVPMRISDITWYRDLGCPILNTQNYVAELDTIAKLRAACLLLGIDTEGIL